MPDWSYRPMFRPLLFKVPPERARKVTLSALGALAAMPLGPELIDFMGHLAPSPALARDVAGMAFGSPVGLGAGLDVDARATKALERFGFGFIEIGPVTIEPVPSHGKVERLREIEAIRYRGPGETVDLPSIVKRLDRHAPSRLPLAIRIASLPDSDLDAATAQCIQVVNALQGHAAFWTLGAGLDFDQRGWSAALLLEHLAAVLRAIQTHPVPRPLFLCLPPDIDSRHIDDLIEPALAFGLAGVSITGGSRSATACDRLVGMPTRLASLRTVRAIRTGVGSRVAIIGSGGVLQPADALLLLHAGADLVQVHSGLVFGGPGLPKRINDAVEALAIDRRRDGENQGTGEESSRAVAQTRHRSFQGTGSAGSATAPGGIGARRIAASIVHDKAPGWLYGTLYGIGIGICVHDPRPRHASRHDDFDRSAVRVARVFRHAPGRTLGPAYNRNLQRRGFQQLLSVSWFRLL
jgi:dihydroorotate dehydrogenase